MVAHGADVREAGNNPDGVGHAFPFGSGRRSGIGKTDDAAAQVQHGRFKTEPCAGAGFVKTGGKFLAFAHSRIFLHIVLDIIGQIKELVQFFDREIKGTH